LKLLITGICGFAGSQIACHWLDHVPATDLQIIGIDNFSRNGSWRNRDALVKRGIRILHGDIRNSSDLEAVGPVDFVIDAAANASVLAGVAGQSSSRQLIEYNLQGTINLLEFCKQHQAGFILLSTSRVYSIPGLARMPVNEQQNAFQPNPDAGELPAGVTSSGIAENYSTAAPVSLYGATKLASEQLALEYGFTFNFPVWINRCGVMAGAGQFGKADQGIFAFWLHSWKENRPLKYIGFGGHGFQVRDCLHPRDLVSLLVQQVATTNDDRPPVVNFSGGASSARSLAQLSEWCTHRWGPRTIASDPTPRAFDLPWVVLDNSLASQVWNWRPQTTTDQILDEIANFADTQANWIGDSA
jgi:CDP-paratose 2-epimerase